MELVEFPFSFQLSVGYGKVWHWIELLPILATFVNWYTYISYIKEMQEIIQKIFWMLTPNSHGLKFY